MTGFRKIRQFSLPKILISYCDISMLLAVYTQHFNTYWKEFEPMYITEN